MFTAEKPFFFWHEIQQDGRRLCVSSSTSQIGDNHQGIGVCALDTMARLWFKRIDKDINKTVSCCKMTREIGKKGGWKTTHHKVSQKEEIQSLKNGVRK